MTDHVERSWFYCPIREHWAPWSQRVAVKNGYVVRGHRYFSICKSCLLAIKKNRRRKN